MSVLALAFPRPSRELDRSPRLELLLGEGRRLGTLGYLLLLATIAIAGILAHVAIAAVASQNAFTEQQLRLDVRESSTRVQILQQQLTVMDSPATLQRHAQELGMVPMGAPVFIRLADGEILGEPGAAAAAATTSAPKLDTDGLAMTNDGSAVLHPSQLPTDDSAILISRKAVD